MDGAGLDMLQADAERAWAWLSRDCVANHAARRPEQMATVELASGRALTYRELDDEIGRCAAALAARISPGGRVALLARNSLAHAVMLYATARAGVVFSPLNWRLPAAELKVLLADSEAELLFYDAEFETTARDAAAGLKLAIESTADLDWPEADPAARPATPLAPDAPWVLLYTSGTTGRPKGVIITRRNAFFAAYNFVHVSGFTTASVPLCDPPLFHVAGLMGVLHPGLSAGACVLISDRFVPATTLARLSDPNLGVTHYFSVPQMAQALLDDKNWPTADLSRLQALFCGGAPVPEVLARALVDAGVPLSTGYGLSEACTVMHMPINDPRTRAKPSACGIPAPAVEVRLVGRDGQDVPRGEVGEVWLRGPAITPGYWRQPEATAAAFSDGWYRTGDAGRQDEDGFFHLVDRWKDMYITGGENVYPAEVEAAILEIAGVGDVGVVGVPDPRWGEAGCAFIVLAPGAAVDAETVAAFCRTRLAGYKRPAAVRFVEAIPRNASGKIRKDVLRAMAAESKPGS